MFFFLFLFLNSFDFDNQAAEVKKGQSNLVLTSADWLSKSNKFKNKNLKKNSTSGRF